MKTLSAYLKGFGQFSVFEESNPDDANKGTDPNKGVETETFTKADVDQKLAEATTAHKAQVQKMLDEQKALATKATLTTKERQELEKRMELTQNELLTEKERAQKEKQKLQTAHEETVSNLTAEASKWKEQFTKSTIERSITDAAAEMKAYRPAQIVALLSPTTALVESLDEHGQPTGVLGPKVTFTDRNEKGEAVTLQLSPKDAVKRMSEMEDFMNLFISDSKGGAGSHTQKPTGNGSIDVAKLIRDDPEQYKKLRKEGKLGLPA